MSHSISRRLGLNLLLLVPAFTASVSVGVAQQAAPALATASAADAPAPRSSARNSYTRLARAPSMFGDSPGQSTTIRFPIMGQATGDTNYYDTTVPLGGGTGATKIAENGCTLPADRVFFNYNQYAGILGTTTTTPMVPTPTGDGRYGTYTAGIERMFLDGNASIEVRMPFHDDLGITDSNYDATIGNIGNLAIYGKALLYADEESALGAGVAVILPTGSDFRASTTTDLEVRNDAVHLAPYLAALYLPSDEWFIQGFAQFDFAANGNTVFTDQRRQEWGEYNEQNLLLLDVSLGRWLYLNPQAERFLGVAAVFELHYTTTLQNTDSVAFAIPGVQADDARIFNALNRLDVLNATLGANILVTPSSNLRVAGVAPLTGANDRLFDGELQISMNHYY